MKRRPTNIDLIRYRIEVKRLIVYNPSTVRERETDKAGRGTASSAVTDSYRARRVRIEGSELS